MKLRHNARRPHRAFTLVELLVVIGIIVVLMSIAIPIVNSARRSADVARSKLDLNAIALALEAYKQDFKDYPRPPRNLPNEVVLAWALIGPFQADSNSPNLGPAVTKYDGADGPGFRTQWDATAKTGSKTWGPYLAADKFPLSDDKLTLKDRFGGNIDYFPRWRTPQKSLKLFDTANTSATALGVGIYDWHQGDQTPTAMSGTTPKAVLFFQKALGDTDFSDAVAGTEQLGTCPEFLLLSRGPTGDFDFKDKTDLGPMKLEKMTEVSNLP